MRRFFTAFSATLLIGLAGQSFGAVAYVSQGAAVQVGNAVSPLPVVLPATIAANEMLVICVVQRVQTSTITTPDGWTAPANSVGAGGAGAEAADTGTVKTSLFYKIADGTEDGSTVNITVSGESCSGVALSYSRGGTSWALPGVCNGADSTEGVDWSVTGNNNPAITGGDMLIVVSGANTDAYAFSAQVLAATGVTFGAMNERADINHSANGFDRRFVVTDHAVTSGTSSDAPVYTMTASGSATSVPCGASVMFRIRELTGSAVDPLSASIPGNSADPLRGL